MTYSFVENTDILRHLSNCYTSIICDIVTLKGV